MKFYLFKGGGKADHPNRIHTIWNIPRYSFLGKISKRGYFFEQLTFLVGMLPNLLFLKPDIIFYSDLLLGRKLSLVRKVFGLKFKLLLSNGAPSPPPFPYSDYVQQLLPSHLKKAIAHGEDANKHILLPYGFKLTKTSKNTLAEKQLLRENLNLPKDKTIIISIGAINNYHKRMSYLIGEVSDLGRQDVFLLLVGQQEKESIDIIHSGLQLLGEANFRVITAHPSQIHHYLLAADLFVLASLNEGFGRVLIEAQQAGLPTLVHDLEVFHEVLGKYGNFLNMKVKGNLKTELSQWLEHGEFNSNNQEGKEYFFNRYDWSQIKSGYITMFEQVLAC